MIRKKQIIVIGSVVILIGFLFSRDIKGLVKPKEDGKNAPNVTASAPKASAVTLNSVSAESKQFLKPGLSEELGQLEQQFNKAQDAEKLSLAKQLAQKWDDVNLYAPSAFYYELIAEKESTLKNWLTTGDKFTAAFDHTADTVAQPVYLGKAKAAYQKALAIDPNSLDAKTGVGIATVNGLGMPMEGIALLLEVVKKDPQNVKANMNLGIFSLKSGQFDKAIGRFKTVVAKQPIPEAWFYLGTAYENLNQMDEAITAYLKCKELAVDPGLTKFVDKKVAELKSKS